MSKIVIILGNSYSQIQGLNSNEFSKLKKSLSYTLGEQQAFYTGGFAHRKYLIDKKGFFPTGLLYVVKKQHPTAPIADNRILPSRLPSNTPDLGVKPHEWQISAVTSAIKAGRGGIVAPTGSGKSLVIALIASRLKVKTLVVVPTLEIKKQLQEALKTFNVRRVTVENIDSAELRGNGRYDCLIIDECHHVAASTYQKLNKIHWTNIYYRFFLTATWGRNDTNEQLLFEGIAGEVVYKLSYKEAISKGYIVPIEAYYIDLPKQKTEAHTWREVYNELVVNNKSRNQIIANLLSSLESENKSTLCLVKEINHGEKLFRMTTINFVNGQDDESRVYIKMFNERDFSCLIATTGIMGEGVDSKPCEYVIIAGLGKAKSAFMQQIGRAVRTYSGKESAKVIIFRDTSHKFTLRHFNAQKKILLDEYGVAVIKLEL